ncbi:hypothetical protein M0R45_008554 [Rubus argutus]|uniref:Uncharacterized protein n=1 Tax=Rubus argutus TaxID=59490 RepID=A0AAW1Y328_RUBAR
MTPSMLQLKDATNCFRLPVQFPPTIVLNPEVEVIEPVVKGTLNVFKASFEVKIKRVVSLLLLCPSILGGLKVKCRMRLAGGMGV